MLMKGRGVGFEAALVFEAALDEIEGDLRQPPLRHPMQVFDIDGFVDVHLRASPRPAAKRCSMAYFCAGRQSPSKAGLKCATGRVAPIRSSGPRAGRTGEKTAPSGALSRSVAPRRPAAIHRRAAPRFAQSCTPDH